MHIRFEVISLVWMVILTAVIFAYDTRLKQSIICSNDFLACLIAVAWLAYLGVFLIYLYLIIFSTKYRLIDTNPK